MKAAALAALLRVIGIGDTQNQVTSYADERPAVPVEESLAELRAMADWICSEKPDFVVQVGDLTDSTGGASGSDLDDPDTAALPIGIEWLRVKANLADRLEACGVALFLVSGNHDSYRDFERVFPAAAFEAKPWAHAVHRRMYADGSLDTEQRAAVFQTRVGPVCVVGADFAMDAADRAWVGRQVGCGAGLPTICVRHDAPEISECTVPNVFAAFQGHWVLPAGMLTAMRPGRLWSFFNWQEVRMRFALEPQPRGLGFLADFVWDTDAKTVRARAWSPIHQRSEPIGEWNFQNVGGVFPFDWCARFPGGPACVTQPPLPSLPALSSPRL